MRKRILETKSLETTSKLFKQCGESIGVTAVRLFLISAVVLTSVVLSACTKQVSVSTKRQSIAGLQVTQAPNEVLYPDDSPSIPDGKVLYQKLNCAQCHGLNGETPVQLVSAHSTAGPGRTAKVVPAVRTFSLNDRTWADNQQPVQEYKFLTFGNPGLTHPILRDLLTMPQRWDLVFYVRSLAVPAITDAEWLAVDPVWGSNCAVCHGKRGTADGPLTKGNTLEPVPANFHSFPRFYARSDNELFSHIAYGISWEGMPNFLGKYDHAKNVRFDAAYIHKLVQYVRAFHSTNKPIATAATTE